MKEQIPLSLTPFTDRLSKIIPGIYIPYDFWDLSYDTQKSIVENLEIKKESGMKVTQLHLDFLDLIKISPEFESMGSTDSDTKYKLQISEPDEDAKNFTAGKKPN